MFKRFVLSCLVVLGVCVCFACEKASYKAYAKNYGVSEHDIQKIIGLYVHSDNLVGYRTWSEYTDERWGKGYTTNDGRVTIDGIAPKNADENLAHFLGLNDDGVLRLVVEAIEKVEDSRYKLMISDENTRKGCGYMELTFNGDSNVSVRYMLDGSITSSTTQSWLKTSGPLLLYKPLAGAYVVAPEPYSKDARVYKTYEELQKGENEYMKQHR